MISIGYSNENIIQKPIQSGSFIFVNCMKNSTSFFTPKSFGIKTEVFPLGYIKSIIFSLLSSHPLKKGGKTL